MEGVVCKITNSRPKVIMSQRITLMYPIVIAVKSGKRLASTKTVKGSSF
jgi:hypothetical protein